MKNESMKKCEKRKNKYWWTDWLTDGEKMKNCEKNKLENWEKIWKTKEHGWLTTDRLTACDKLLRGSPLFFLSL